MPGGVAGAQLTIAASYADFEPVVYSFDSRTIFKISHKTDVDVMYLVEHYSFVPYGTF
jgi:hypothetical protein